MRKSEATGGDVAVSAAAYTFLVRLFRLLGRETYPQWSLRVRKRHAVLLYSGEFAVDLFYCGRQRETDFVAKIVALRLLKSAIEQNYCAYTALQTDPLLVKLRGTLSSADCCRQRNSARNRFLAQRDQSPQ
jgi:hypothetical protein